MDFFVTILGSSSATFHKLRGLTAHVVSFKGRYFLIDCGEGTQIQMQRYGTPMQKISSIFISHLHGDHFYGLIGLLSTYHLFHRKAPLHIYSHAALREIITMQLEASETTLAYPLHFHVIEEGSDAVLYEDEEISISTFPLVHSIPANGFFFQEKNVKRSLIKEKIKPMNLPHEAYSILKDGEDYRLDDDTLVRAAEVSKNAPPPRSYAYCSDTGYSEAVVPYIRGATLLYHEATFLDGDAPSERLRKYHTNSREAALIAAKARVNHLIIGHFSARYNTLKPLLDEARMFFPNTVPAIDGKRYLINYQDE
jgi:ribonuclease Z